MTISELSYKNNKNTDPFSAVQVITLENPAEYGEFNEEPYFTITPTVWFLTMLTGAGMWAVFFYIMHMVLNFIF